MPITTLLKRLRLKMATMQSQRSQCCCCAVGIFACMFGFFMLSAGICILLNLTFMDVDTSGLPPNLQNDDGKKVVGILLICVAVAALGLSMTVSIVYFFICGRTDDKKPTNSNGGQHDGHHKGQNNSYQPNGSTVANGKHRSQRTGSRDSSQVSIRSHNSRRISSPDSAAGISMTAASSGAAYRSHHHAERKRQKNRRLGNKMLRPNLPTHTEEDPESARSLADLKHHDKQGKSTFYVDRPDDDEIDAGTLERKLTPPVIVIDNFSTLTSTPKGHTDSVDSLISETAFIEDEERQDRSERRRYGEPALDRPDSNLPSGNHASRNLSSDFDQQAILENSKFTSDKSSCSEQATSVTNSQNDYKNHKGAALDTVSLDSEFSSVSHQHSREAPHSTRPGPSQTDKLPSKSGNSGIVSAKIGDRHDADLDMRSDSRSSFNSAFSMDGGDPELSDNERVQQTMKELLVERL